MTPETFQRRENWRKSPNFGRAEEGVKQRHVQSVHSEKLSWMRNQSNNLSSNNGQTLLRLPLVGGVPSSPCPPSPGTTSQQTTSQGPPLRGKGLGILGGWVGLVKIPRLPGAIHEEQMKKACHAVTKECVLVQKKGEISAIPEAPPNGMLSCQDKK